MAIKLGEYLIINFRAANGIFEQKSLKELDALNMVQKLADKFDAPFVLVKVLAIAPPSASIPPRRASLSPSQEGSTFLAPLEGPTQKAE